MEKIIEANATDEYKRSMVIYAMEANRRRQLPDAKDGLKLVVRRIMDAMFNYENCDKRLVKTAAVVGTCMKVSHPHGDCQRASTEVYGLDGNIRTIGDIYTSGIQQMHILAVDPSTGKVVPAIAHSFRIGQYTDKIYHIQLSNGAEVQCTGNHPFMLYDRTWIKAQDIKPYTLLYNKTYRYNNTNRPSIDNQLIQDMVYEKYYGKLPTGYHKHHIDYNPYNNIPSNFATLTAEDYIRIHGHDISSLSSLEEGRNQMFSEGDKYVEKIKKKNSILDQEFNKDQGLRRFKHVIQLMIEQNMDLTIENYESFRGKIYNLPYPDKLIESHPEYGCKTFEELVLIKIPTIRELYQQRFNEMDRYNNIEQNENLERPMSYLYDNYFIRESIFNNLEKMIIEGIPLTVNDYYLRFNNSNVDPFKLPLIIDLFKIEKPYVENVWIEDVNQEPMFDFTVDGLENMLIPVASQLNRAIEGIVGLNIPMICIHNSSIEDAIKPLTNWFESKIPLIEGHGNFGSMQGDGAAASRYTEVRLSKFALDCLIGELKESKDIVDWVPTYDNTHKEPEYLPAAVPLLLINGTYGIGVGIKVEIPKHNLIEVLDATINLIKNPDAPVVLIPDHCMPCEIIDTNWKAISNKGEGKYKVRAVIDTEKVGDCYRLIIKSVPDRVFFDKGNAENGGTKYKILDMVKNGKLPQITRIDEDSHKDQMRIIIYLRKGSDPQFVKEMLYANTNLEDSFSVNFRVLNGIELVRMSYKSYLEFWIQERLMTKFRLYCSKLQQVRTKYHERDAYIKLLESGEIDNVINMIKKRTTIDDTAIIEYLINKLKITDLQAKFIINSNLKNLSMAYLNKYKEDAKILLEREKDYIYKITNDDVLLQEIIDELTLYKQKYGEPRKCRIIKKDEISAIPKGEFKIVITENNYIKKLNPNDYVGAYKGDNPKHIIKVENTENILLFSEQGKVYKMPVHKIPLTEKNSVGSDIRILVKGLTSNITKVLYEPNLINLSKKINKHFITVVTAGNYIKKLDIEDFLNVPPSGILFTKLNPDDYVKDILIVENNLDVIIYSNRKALRINMSEIPHYKRNTLGVAAMNTSAEIDGISIIYPDATDIVVITEQGKVNKFNITGLQKSARYKAGSSVIKLGKTDSINSIFGVNDSNVIRVTTKTTKLDINVDEIPNGSSISQGSKMIQIKSDIIVKCDVYKK